MLSILLNFIFWIFLAVVVFGLLYLAMRIYTKSEGDRSAKHYLGVGCSLLVTFSIIASLPIMIFSYYFSTSESEQGPVVGEVINNLQSEEIASEDENNNSPSSEQVATADYLELIENKKEEAREAYKQGVQIFRQAYLFSEYEIALEHLTEATELDPEFAAAWAYRAAILESLKFNDEARQDIAKANKFDSLDPVVASMDAYFIFEDTGSTRAAFNRIQPLIDENLDTIEFAVIYRRAAFLANEEEDYIRAIEFANNSIALDPNYSYAYSEKRYAQVNLAIQNELNEELLRNALSTSEKELALYPNCPSCYWGRSYILSWLNRHSDAVLEGNKAIDLADDEGADFDHLTSLYIEQAYYYVELNNFRQANQNLNKALEVGIDENNEYYFVKGYAADKSNDYETAFESYMEFLQLEEDDYGRTRYACSRANDLEIYTAADLVEGFFSMFTIPCDRYPSEQTNGGGSYGSEQLNEVVCTSERIGTGSDGYGIPGYRCEDSYGNVCIDTSHCTP